MLEPKAVLKNNSDILLIVKSDILVYREGNIKNTNSIVFSERTGISS